MVHIFVMLTNEKKKKKELWDLFVFLLVKLSDDEKKIQGEWQDEIRKATLMALSKLIVVKIEEQIDYIVEGKQF